MSRYDQLDVFEINAFIRAYSEAAIQNNSSIFFGYDPTEILKELFASRKIIEEKCNAA